MKKKIQTGAETVALLALAALIFFGYYYWKTPSSTVLVTPDPFPSGLSLGFTPDQLTNHLLASLQDIRVKARSSSASRTHGSQVTIGVQLASPTKGPVYLPTKAPIPAFDQKVWKWDMNTLREGAVFLKAKGLLQLDATATGGNNFRLLAALKEKPNFQTLDSWNVPVGAGPCGSSEACTGELAEDIVGFFEPRALVLFLLQRGDEGAFRKIVDLYESRTIAAKDLTRDDYFVWADALRGIKEYDQAINKYQEILDKDTQFCSGYDEVGFTHLLKYQSENRMEHLDAAERAFRQAIACDQHDAVAHCDLGNTLMRRWIAGKRLNDRFITEAIEHSQKALDLDPQRAEAAVNFGYIQYARGQHQHALDYFRGISQKFATNSALFLNFGFLLYKEYLGGNGKLLQEATDKTRRAWDLNKNSWMAANNLGFLYFEEDNLPNAVKFWKQAYSLNPTDSDILAGLALGLFKSGQPGQRDEAIAHFREAIRREGPKIQNTKYLRMSHSWSQKATQDVVPLIQAATGGA